LCLSSNIRDGLVGIINQELRAGGLMLVEKRR
jgi:hypothetical protein